jgi:hypothetical protein
LNVAGAGGAGGAATVGAGIGSGSCVAATSKSYTCSNVPVIPTVSACAKISALASFHDLRLDLPKRANKSFVCLNVGIPLYGRLNMNETDKKGLRQK